MSASMRIYSARLNFSQDEFFSATYWPDEVTPWDNSIMSKKVTPRLKRSRPTYFFRAWRDHRGLTQEQVAERVAMSVSSISQIETGAQGFTDSTLMAFAEALNVDPGDLLSRDPLIEGTIIDLLRLIRAKDQAMVLNVLRALPDRTGTQG
jgi:transcriptional regulator with XRE-family HTH domain